MSRHVNPGLFGDYVPTEAKPEGPIEALPLLENLADGPTNEEVMVTVQKVRFQNEEWVKSISLRFEKVVQKIHNLEDRINKIAVDTKEHLAFANSRFKERHGSDLKVEALIERHNQIVQNFDLRLTQSQRVIENQSLQLAKQQELIDDSRRQIERLKKL